MGKKRWKHRSHQGWAQDAARERPKGQPPKQQPERRPLALPRNSVVPNTFLEELAGRMENITYGQAVATNKTVLLNVWSLDPQHRTTWRFLDMHLLALPRPHRSRLSRRLWLSESHPTGPPPYHRNLKDGISGDGPIHPSPIWPSTAGGARLPFPMVVHQETKSH